MKIKFRLDGFLKGGFPIDEEAIEIISELDYYDEVIELISSGDSESAKKLLEGNFKQNSFLKTYLVLKKMILNLLKQSQFLSSYYHLLRKLME